MLKISNIKSLLKASESLDKLQNKLVCVTGRINTIRGNSKIVFITLNDGTTLQDLQIVCKEQEIKNLSQLLRLKRNSVIEVTGELIVTPNKPQPCEVKAHNVIIIIEPLFDHPLQKKVHSLEFLRSIAHLRIQSKIFRAIAVMKNETIWAIHNFFHKKSFVLIQTPCITSNDAEGGGESFNVTTIKNNKHSDVFFGKNARLAVSGQLHAESYAQGLKAVYTFGPTFRAENSNTAKHISEFWMLEPEFVYATLNKNMNLIEELIKYIANYLLSSCEEEITFLKKIADIDLTSNYHNIVNKQFARISYKDAIKQLQQAMTEGYNFENKDIYFGMDLQTEHERYIAEKIAKGPVFLFDFPKSIKAFYMKVNDDNETVSGCDLLVPGIGELVGGSQREDDYNKLLHRINELNLNTDNLQWYIDLRKYGYIPSAGFGLGFERLMMYLTGVKNIRDISAFPRAVKSLNY